METTKARSPNLMWHLKCLDDHIRMSTEFSMLKALFCRIVFMAHGRLAVCKIILGLGLQVLLSLVCNRLLHGN